jgi:hypothetical protein
MTQKLKKVKTKAFLLIFFLVFGLSNVSAQVKSKKELRKERKVEQQKQIAIMVNAKEFVFVANRALPQGYKTVDLTTNSNSLKFQPEMIESYMPYFGRAYNVKSGSDTGIKFEGKPDEFTVITVKRGYEVRAKVKSQYDYFDLYMTIGFEGNASLTITSNNRSTITYYGNIESLEKIK